MPPRLPAHSLAITLSRFGGVLLALTALLPSQPVRAGSALQALPVSPMLGPAGVNVPPVANDDSLAAFTDQGWQTLYVLDNDTDPNFDPLTVTSVSFAANGQAVGGGLTGPFFAVDYKPNAGFSGIDHFNYTISDGHGFTDTAAVAVHVGPSGTASSRFAVYATSKNGYDSSRWTVNPKSGATSPNGGFCIGASGLGIEDVLLQTPLEHMKAFDTGLTLWINNKQVKPVLPMAVTHRSLLSGPVVVTGTGNLTTSVSVRYDGLVGSDTLRTLATITNLSGATKNITVTVATNLGSDYETVIVGSSTHDTDFTTDDRWLVTSDDLINPGLIVDTHVLFGSGAAVTPSRVFTGTFACNGDSPNFNILGVGADFHLFIPNGGTKRLLFFNQAHSTNTAALSDAGAFFTGNPLGLLGGLSAGELSQIVNWNLVGPISRLYLPLVKR